VNPVAGVEIATSAPGALNKYRSLQTSGRALLDDDRCASAGSAEAAVAAVA
jgi:hypothetical protein